LIVSGRFSVPRASLWCGRRESECHLHQRDFVRQPFLDGECVVAFGNRISQSEFCSKNFRTLSGDCDFTFKNNFICYKNPNNYQIIKLPKKFLIFLFYILKI